MDIYEFINSKDIREHCRKIGHKFSGIEAAFLIFHSRSHTIAQKHAAWLSLIEEYPDTKVEATRNCDGGESFHDFLRKYMALEDRLLGDFFSKEDTVFSFAATFDGGAGLPECWSSCKYSDTRETGALYYDFATGLSVENDFNLNRSDFVHEGLMFYTVRKQALVSSKGQKQMRMSIRVNKDGEPLAIEHWGNDHIPEKEWELLYYFEDMWVDVPTPFRKGDILFANRISEGYYPDPFVLKELCTEYVTEKMKEHCDTTDMSAVGYRICGEAGHICRDNIHDYLSFEYFTGELTKPYRILTAINRFINGKIDIDTLMQAYHYLLAEGELEYGDKYALGLSGILEKMYDDKNT